LNFFEAPNLNCLFVKKCQVNTQAPEANCSRVILEIIEKNDVQKIFGPHVLV